MKKLLPLLCLVLLGGGIYLATHYVADHYLSNRPKTTDLRISREVDSKDATKVKCRSQGQAHVVEIRNNTASPALTQASRCDSLTVINTDNRLRLIAFGEHEHHQAYDNTTEKTLRQSQKLTIVLDQTGTYVFHDHYQSSVESEFVVN
ncbi:MAG: hypothetical protein AAB971_02400 [Patescibacteria group bacterium]